MSRNFFELQRFTDKIRLSNYADSYTNETSDVIIYARGGNDKIYNYAGTVTIDGGAGSDSISNNYYSNNVSINGGKGNDSIYSNGDYVTVNGGSGNDSIYNNGYYVTVNGGAGNDYINNNGGYVTVNGGKGNDSIGLSAWSYGNVVQYAKGDGNDTIIGFDSYDTLHITKGTYSTKVQGNDVIVKVGNNSITIKNAVNMPLQIKNSSGKVKTVKKYNEIFNFNSNTVVSGKKTNSGRDYIESTGDKVTISSGKGNDSIYSNGDNVSINSGDGMDTIYSNGDMVTINSGDGMDTIYSSGDMVTINSGDGADYIKTSNAYYVNIDGGSGSDTIYHSIGSYAAIFGGAGMDSVYNSGGFSVVKGDSGNDRMSNSGEFSVVKGDSGNDLITNSGAYSTISGGTGNDTINNRGKKSLLSGGKGNDQISNSGSKVTINGGAGNDSIGLSGAYKNVVQYAKGDGNDTVVGFDSDDNLRITKGTYSTKVQGNDIIVKVGTGSITLKDAADREISIIDSKGQITTKTYYGSSSSVSLIEDNIATADNLSEIVQNDLSSVGEVEAQNFEKRTQENLITYSK